MSWLLLLQFAIMALLPLGFLVLAGYTVRQRPVSGTRLGRWWILALLLLAAWATRQLTPFLGREVSDFVSYYWRAFAHYPLVLSGSVMLIATTLYLDRPLPRRVTLAAGPILALLALALDPALWGGGIPPLSFGGLTFRHFDLWAITWVGAWLWPMSSAWLWAEQIMRQAPISIYRNQARYWVVIVSVAFLGGSLALLRDLLAAQQGGALLLLVGMFLGTLAITRFDLPDLPTTMRRLAYHFSRGIAIFFVAWLALYLLGLFVANAAAQTTIIVAAGLLTFLLLGLLAGMNRLARLWLFGRPTPFVSPLLAEPVQTGLLPPAELAGRFEETVRGRFGSGGGWTAVVEETPAGGLVIRPVGGSRAPGPVSLPGDSPLVEHLLTSDMPLTPADIDHLPVFKTLPAGERNMLEEWGAALYLPLRAGSRLVGLFALRYKRSGDRYGRAEFAQLQQLGREMGIQLAQARTLQALQQSSLLLYERHASLTRDWRRLQELVTFYEQFAGLLAPELLRRPFTEMAVQLQQLESRLAAPAGAGNGHGQPAGEVLAGLSQQVVDAQAMVDNLIAIASHLEKQAIFEFGEVYLDQVARGAVEQLRDMAAGRRSTLQVDIRGRIAPVWGDGGRLSEALQQLLHNAIKFNRLGGEVTLTCQMVRNEVRLEVADEGVGIPPERLEMLWEGLQKPFGRDTLGARRRTRIGLPLTRFIVQAHGGRIEVESTPGHGSIFRIFLPAVLPDS